MLHYTWSILQTILGFILSRIILLRDKNTRKLDGPFNTTVFISAKMKGGISLGKYIIVQHKSLIRHESGHTKQSLLLGPLYLFIIGIPSFIWATIYTLVKPKISYYSFYTEKWADKNVGIIRNG